MRIHLQNFKLIFLLLMSSGIISCNEKNSDSKTIETPIVNDSTSSSLQMESEFTFSVFMNDSADKSKGYGYDILMNNTRQIHQTNIPAVSGNQFFKTENDAATTATYALYKLQKYQQMPVLTVRELDSLGVIPHSMQ